jgi:chemotaxis protein methyltransferase CheR
MLKGRGEHKGVMKVSPELHRVVRFARVNLHADVYPLQGFFDLIFCRNVLIYFDQKSKEKVINGIVRHLSTSGLLFVGHSEHLGGISPSLKSIAPTVHALMPVSGELLTQDGTPNVVSGRAL